MTVVTASTLAGVVAGATAITYCAGVTVSSAGHAAWNIQQIKSDSSSSGNQQIHIHLKINDTKYFLMQKRSLRIV